jgi:hypothetical protein
MQLIPISIIDDFFEDPDGIVDYALSLDYDENDPYYPGIRTKCLSQINFRLYEEIVFKYLNHFIDFQGPFVARVQFHKVSNDWSFAEIHKDAALTGVVHLTKNNHDSGTTFYKKDGTRPINSINYEEKFQYVNNNDVENYKRISEENNKGFRKTVEVSSEYNRLIAFDGASNWHAASKFDSSDFRLTCVIFVYNVAADGWGSFRARERAV